MTYEEPSPIARAEAERDMASPDADAVCRALVRAALHDSDWRWVQAWALRLARELAPAGARLRGHQPRARCTPQRHARSRRGGPPARGAHRDPAIGGRAEDALGDIRVFVKRT